LEVKLPIVNLEETPGKTVGKIRRTAADYDRLVAASRELMPRLPFPKGVYRFRTFQEADEWMHKHMLEAAVKKRLARLTAKT
jgi:hypothetical protein